MPEQDEDDKDDEEEEAVEVDEAELGFWYMQLPAELLAPVDELHVSQVPVPSHPPSDIARQTALVSHADRAEDSLPYVSISWAELQYRSCTCGHGFWYTQLPAELELPLLVVHVFQLPVPSQRPSEIPKQESLDSHATRASDMEL